MGALIRSYKGTLEFLMYRLWSKFKHAWKPVSRLMYTAHHLICRWNVIGAPVMTEMSCGFHVYGIRTRYAN